MSFEKTIGRIDEIIAMLEKGDMPLEKAVELYTEGVAAAAACKKQLDDAKLKLSMINPETGEVINVGTEES